MSGVGKHDDLLDERLTPCGIAVYKPIPGLPLGGGSRYLDRIALILNGLSVGLGVSKAMFAAFIAADLIEPVKLEIKFTNPDEQYDLLGLHTINQQKLANLDAESLHRLNSAGFLQ